ncbi:hypothetical protein I6A60_36775 [Frankia sp. AgB1.9]|uniref:hypothetical protein n=1 Tax=unclassified Frankia TaxID=2632575 RepID=UPI001933176C|nr:MULTISPECIES: hypothetical protein [unclassified Frankia]MBL7553365.1 hypothetical protein [Frankia sp. AgB1.9]
MAKVADGSVASSDTDLDEAVELLEKSLEGTGDDVRALRSDRLGEAYFLRYARDETPVDLDRSLLSPRDHSAERDNAGNRDRRRTRPELDTAVRRPIPADRRPREPPAGNQNREVGSQGQPPGSPATRLRRPNPQRTSRCQEAGLIEVEL